MTRLTRALAVACAAGTFVSSSVVAQATRTWTGGGGNSSWTTAGNWGGIAPVAGDNLVFDATGVGVNPGPSNTFPAATTFRSITVSASGYNISGASVSLTQGLTVNTYAAGSSSVSLVVGGAAPVTMSAAGTLVLSGANTFTGGLVIKSGTVNGAASATAFGAVSSVITLGDVSGSADATLNAGFTGTFAHPITVAGGSSGNTLRITNTGTVTFSGPISLNHDLTFVPTLSLVLTCTGGITGTGNIIVSGTGTGAALTLSGGAVNPFGTITNQGTNLGTTTISGGVGANVTAITEASTTSALTISTAALVVN
ncbi:MAG TPA: autotransporter-associated beta strand repeat-containing protein, partial [Gemmatimonadaceae bacterium]|nr:autotransporter-associated beta strand repeat-containing protein [Gemmatimonadaceae bacterium]